MKILIGGATSKFFHLKEFADALTKFDVEYRLVNDTEISDGYPSRKISNWFNNSNKFKKLIDNFKPDIIFVDRQRHFGLDAIEANIPVLMHLRGDFWKEIQWAKETQYKSFPKSFAIKKWEQIGEKSFEGSNIILPICEYLEKITKKKFPGKPTYVLQSGIDPSRWYHEKGLQLKHPCVGLLQGAHIWGKAQEMLTLEKVLKEFPKITFYWAGDGPYAEKILLMLEKYPNFKWLGNLDYPDKVRQFLTEIDIYALISGMDMSPHTVLEASLMEKPVIATNVGGIPELIKDGETGFLVEKGNSEELIEKILFLINNREKAIQMGQKGRKFIENNFSWEKVGENFINIMKKLELLKN